MIVEQIPAILDWVKKYLQPLLQMDTLSQCLEQAKHEKNHASLMWSFLSIHFFDELGDLIIIIHRRDEFWQNI